MKEDLFGAISTPSAHLRACSLADICSGCPWISIPYETQVERKRQAFTSGWRALGFKDLSFAITSAGPLESRERVDLQLRGGSAPLLGLFETGKREIVAMEECPAMSPQLESWFQDFKRDLPSIEKGSVRLRVAPDGTRGIWLDLANEDVKRLFEEKSWLERLSKKGIVEIGQRKKRLSFSEEGHEGRPRLIDPILHGWITTPIGDESVPLWTVIGSFTQPGEAVNHLLVKTVMGQTALVTESNWLELGAGAGNFTLPLLASGKSVIAVELDALAVRGMKQAATMLSLESRLELVERNFESAGALPRVEPVAILVDPPRSGLGKFLASPILSQAVALTYVSCWTENFFKDAVGLRELGFQPVAAEAVDLFPGTPYAEWVVTFIRESK